MKGEITKDHNPPFSAIGVEPAGEQPKSGPLEVREERRPLVTLPKEVQETLKEEVPLIKKRRMLPRRKADRTLVKTETITRIDTIGDLRSMQDAGYYFTAEEETSLGGQLGMLLLWILAFAACAWMIGHALGYF